MIWCKRRVTKIVYIIPEVENKIVYTFYSSRSGKQAPSRSLKTMWTHCRRYNKNPYIAKVTISTIKNTHSARILINTIG